MNHWFSIYTYVFRLLVCLFLMTIPSLVQAQQPSLSATETSMPSLTLVEQAECVVLLHGLARRAASMKGMQEALIDHGYLVANIDYPSRTKPIASLAVAVEEGLKECEKAGGGTVHFVTHSLGGILLRHHLSLHSIDHFGRAVMLGPPNHGSEVVDAMRDVPGYVFLNGPAGLELGTDEGSVPLSLGAVHVDVAVIAGTSSINLILSTHLPDPDDGKVSVASARLDGMCAMLQMPVSHPFLMSDKDIISEVISYLSTGEFNSPEAEYPECGHRFQPQM